LEQLNSGNHKTIMASSLKPVLASLLAVASVTALGQSTLFYQTVTPGSDFVGLATHGNREIGDEISLAGAGSTFTGATFQYNAAAGISGASAIFQLRAMDGPAVGANANSPGTLLFQTGAIPINAGVNTVGISYDGAEGPVVLPQRFSLTVSFSGVTAGADAGLMVGGSYDTSLLGASGNDIWVNTGTGWALEQISGNRANFRVSVTGAVPEPSTIALGVLGAGALGFMVFRRARR
jgi:hypothetical protein